MMQLSSAFDKSLYGDFGDFLSSEGSLYPLYQLLCVNVMKFYLRYDSHFNAAGLFKADDWKLLTDQAMDVVGVEDLQMMDDLGSPAAKFSEYVDEDVEEEKKDDNP